MFSSFLTRSLEKRGLKIAIFSPGKKSKPKEEGRKYEFSHRKHRLVVKVEDLNFVAW